MFEGRKNKHLKGDSNDENGDDRKTTTMKTETNATTMVRKTDVEAVVLKQKMIEKSEKREKEKSVTNMNEKARANDGKEGENGHMLGT